MGAGKCVTYDYKIVLGANVFYMRAKKYSVADTYMNISFCKVYCKIRIGAW